MQIGGAVVAFIPNPIFLFHFTAFGNLESIFVSGAIKAKNVLRVENVKSVNIACDNIQRKRAVTFVGETGKTLHDYVPFYFAPRSPMLYSITHNNVPEAEETDQDNFVYLVSSVDNIRDLQFVFTDYQAIVTYASFYNELTKLDKVCWDLICGEPHFPKPSSPFCGYCKYFLNNDMDPRYVKRKEARLAEFLVLSQVPIDKICMIVVKNQEKKELVENLLHGHGINITIEIRADWYF